MKKNGKIALLSMLLLLGWNAEIKAQTIVPEDPLPKVGIGVRYMPNISLLEVQNVNGDIIEAEFVVGHGFGGLIENNFSKHVGWQIEVIYNTLSQKYEDQNLQRKIKIDYINVPVLLSLNTNRAGRFNVNVVGGPQVGINIGSSLKTTQESNDAETVEGVLAVKPGDLGLAYGAGIELANLNRTMRFDLGFRGVYGLIDISDKRETIETDSFYIFRKTNVEAYSVYVGLTFLF